MKILLIADHEEQLLWDYWSETTASRLSDVDLILSAGDLKKEYLEFLVTMMNVPLVFVHGNHDSAYEKDPPEGCIDADGRMVDVLCGDDARRKVRILGLGGSMRYKKDAPYMYTEKEMKKRITKAKAAAAKDVLTGRLKGCGGPDIILTHAPCKGYGDLDDLPHRGFECFNELLYSQHPKLHVYGHVHREYGINCSVSKDPDMRSDGFRRIIEHPSGTVLVNADSFFTYDLHLDAPAVLPGDIRRAFNQERSSNKLAL